MLLYNAALLIIDVQQGLFTKSTPIYRSEELPRNINTLVERARQADVPIFYVQHSDQKSLVKGSPGWQLHPQLQPVETDCVIEKQHGNAFEATNLDATLKARHIDTLIVTGLVTHGCVRATCLGAKELGYRVVLVRDAHSNYHRQAAQLIETWHQKLETEAIELEFTSAIGFS